MLRLRRYCNCTCWWNTIDVILYLKTFIDEPQINRSNPFIFVDRLNSETFKYRRCLSDYRVPVAYERVTQYAMAFKSTYWKNMLKEFWMRTLIDWVVIVNVMDLRARRIKKSCLLTFTKPRTDNYFILFLICT